MRDRGDLTTTLETVFEDDVALLDKLIRGRRHVRSRKTNDEVTEGERFRRIKLRLSREADNQRPTARTNRQNRDHDRDMRILEQRGYGPSASASPSSLLFIQPHLAHLGAIIQQWSTLAGAGETAQETSEGGGQIAARCACAGALFYEPISLLPSFPPSFRHSEPPARSSSQNFLLRSDWTGGRAGATRAVF